MKKNFFLKILLFIPLVLLALFVGYRFMVFSFPYLFFRPPYFEYNMGEVFKEVSLGEAKGQVDFKIYEPKYIPDNTPPYKVAIRIKPKNKTPEINFYTPEFPGANIGPSLGQLRSSKGIRVSETSLPQKESSEAQKRNISIKGVLAEIESSEINDYLGISFKINDANIWIGSLGNMVNEVDLIKIAESMIPD